MNARIASAGWAGGEIDWNRTVMPAIIIVLLVAMMIAEVAGILGDATVIALWIRMLASGFLVVTMAISLSLHRREMRERRQATADAIQSRKQVERLFEMTDMLQSAIGYSDANSVLRATADRLLYGFGGALYIFNNSRDRLDLSIAWNWPEDQPPPDTVSPTHCWALKRGKSHVNGLGIGALRCEHHGMQIAVLEIPMMARGEVYGLLNIHADGADPEGHLAEIAPLAGAIADAMSLALSNIALREKLRTQALRDPLTGLYNRRYMEDVLERYAHLAERNGSAVSVIMIDLDHFKLLNDKHGHAMGDAVLREVAAAIVGGLRPSDVACRYGGEELIVLLPDCALADALAKAELLRVRVEMLSESHGTPITASFGVATMPETSAQQGDLIAMADGALYQAKQEGRNRVVAAVRRASQLEPTAFRTAAE